jgi:hypothetical protein
MIASEQWKDALEAIQAVIVQADAKQPYLLADALRLESK